MFFGHSFGQSTPPGSQAASNLRHRCEKYTKTNGFCVSYFHRSSARAGTNTRTKRERLDSPIRTCAHCQKLNFKTVFFFFFKMYVSDRFEKGNGPLGTFWGPLSENCFFNSFGTLTYNPYNLDHWKF